MKNFQTMILRFRDLSTPPGTTIDEHKKIIEQKGYVWWGWWNKHGETVPTNAFRAILDKIAQSGPLEVYLFDTGQQLLYSAKLTEIEWDKTSKLIETPEKMQLLNTTETAVTSLG